MNSDSVICVDHLSFWYQKNELILDDVVMEIKPSSRIALIGRNGSGKTTLVETIIGLNTPTKGKVIFPKNLTSSVGCIFQDVDFDRELSLAKLFMFFIKLAKISNKLITEPSIQELADIFSKYELADKLNSRFGSLSGGQKQKFKLMLCLELKPKVLFLDELTTSLDFEWRKKIVKIIRQYLTDHPETSLLLVSHSQDEIESLTNEYFLLQDKKLSKISDLNFYFREY